MRAAIPLSFWSLALFSVALSASAQFLMKVGMTLPNVKNALSGNAGAAALAIATTPQVLAGLAAYGIGALLWLICLSRIPLMMAYPLVSLAIVAVIALSVLFLGESMSPMRFLGSALVVAGVALIGFS